MPLNLLKKKKYNKRTFKEAVHPKVILSIFTPIYCRLKLNSSVTGIVYHRPLV